MFQVFQAAAQALNSSNQVLSIQGFFTKN